MSHLHRIMTVAACLITLNTISAKVQSAEMAYPPVPGRTLLREPVLQRHFAFTDSQRAAMRRLDAEGQAEANRLDRDVTDSDQRRKQLAVIDERLDRKLRELLTDRQRRSLRRIQRYLGLGFESAGALATVERLSAEQERKLEALAAETVVKRVNLFYDLSFNEGALKQTMDPQGPDGAARVRALEEAAAMEVAQLLLPEQAKTFATKRRLKP